MTNIARVSGACSGTLLVTLLLSCSTSPDAPNGPGPGDAPEIIYPTSGDTLLIVREPGVGSAVYLGTGLDHGDPEGYHLTGLCADLGEGERVDMAFDDAGPRRLRRR